LGPAHRATYWLGLGILTAIYALIYLADPQRLSVREVFLIALAVPGACTTSGLSRGGHLESLCSKSPRRRRLFHPADAGRADGDGRVCARAGC